MKGTGFIFWGVLCVLGALLSLAPAPAWGSGDAGARPLRFSLEDTEAPFSVVDAGGRASARTSGDAGAPAPQDFTQTLSKLPVLTETPTPPSGAGLPAVAPLPPIQPPPSVAPVIRGRAVEEPAKPIAPAERPAVVTRTILGLLGLMVLAYLGGHRRVLALEKRFGISQVITAGFPFVLLGLLARAPGIDILSDAVLAELSPLLRLGLGWIGFVAGIRFDTRMFQGLPARTVRIVTFSTMFPFTFLVVACAGLLFVFEDRQPGLDDPVFLRDAMILGTAGAMTAVTSTRWFERNESKSIISRVIRLEELAGVIGLMFVAAFFRPHSASWQMPGTAWMLLTIGLGAAAGLLVYAILQGTTKRADFLVLTLGSIGFAAGAAGHLLLSSVVVSFIAGVLLANFPGTYHERLKEILFRVERPIYLVSLFIVGALWEVGDWRGWVLMPVFMVLRLVGKWLGTTLALADAELELRPVERRAISMPPLGPLSIAIVTNALLLYPGGSISLIVSAVIGGGVLTEVFLQFANRWRLRSSEESEAA